MTDNHKVLSEKICVSMCCSICPISDAHLYRDMECPKMYLIPNPNSVLFTEDDKFSKQTITLM